MPKITVETFELAFPPTLKTWFPTVSSPLTTRSRHREIATTCKAPNTRT
jgi:hypothetical protein